jgi:hypothetical protein
MNGPDDAPQIDITAPDVIYAVDSIRSLVPLIEAAKWDYYTERHLDLKLFGVLLELLNYCIYRDVQSKASQMVRKLSNPEMRPRIEGPLVDYLELVTYIPSSRLKQYSTPMAILLRRELKLGYSKEWGRR